MLAETISELPVAGIVVYTTVKLDFFVEVVTRPVRVEVAIAGVHRASAEIARRSL